MSVTNNIVKAPVSLAELAALLSTTQDVGKICTSTKINKWARYKPMHLTNDMTDAKANPVHILSVADRQLGMMGLSLKTHGSLYKALYNYTNSDAITLTASQLRASLTEATYARPTGGAADPYRISDFLRSPETRSINEASVVTGAGYNHKAAGPDDQWVSVYGITISNLKTAIQGTLVFDDNTKVISASSGGMALPNVSNANIYLTNSFIIGSKPNNAEMSYEDIMGSDSFGGNTDYRMAYAVLIPTVYSNGGVENGMTNKWFIAPARKPFSQSKSTQSGTDTRNLLGDIGANQWLSYQLWCNATHDKDSTFNIVPILVKGLKCKTETITDTSFTTSPISVLHPYIDSSSVVYALPSGNSQQELSITTINASTVPTLFATGSDDGYKAVAVIANRADGSKICLFNFPTGDVNSNGRKIGQYVIVHCDYYDSAWRVLTSSMNMSGSYTLTYNPNGTSIQQVNRTVSNVAKASHTLTIDGTSKALYCWPIETPYPGLSGMTYSGLTFV